MIKEPASQTELPNPALCTTLVELLRWRAEHQPDRTAYVFLRDRLNSEAALTYGALDVKARAIAGWLQDRFQSGDRLLLAFPPGLDFIQTFWGILYAGMIAVPVPPPDALRLKQSAARFQGVAADAGCAGAISTKQTLAVIHEQKRNTLPSSFEHWLTADDLDTDWAAKWSSVEPSSSTLAYLQYTSGSTSTPKGVRVSHGNMVHQSRCITDAGYYDAEAITLSWMPHFHDYGLVKGIIHPAWIGRPSYVMSPLTFLKRPMRWLEAIQRYRVTHSGGPNFAYRHCVESVTPDEAKTLDLSSWRVASCGGEPIVYETIDRFTDAFAAAGFRREAFFPAYGMAEYTLLISLKKAGAPPHIQSLDARALEQGVVEEPVSGRSSVRKVVSCGTPVDDTKVVIVNPDTMSRCAAQQVGEIWLRGASTTLGYWNNAQETERAFRATICDTGEGPFLRTGDLGFVKDGEVYVTGRLKDLLIVRGRNHYPQDIERTVEQCHPLFRAGGGAAFSIGENGEERVVVVQEVERQIRAVDVEEVAGIVRTAVSEEHGLHVSYVVLIKAGSLPKTSSGKTQRRACQQQFQAGQLVIVGRSVLLPSPKHDLVRVPTSKDLRGLTPEDQRQKICRWLQAIIAGCLTGRPDAIALNQPVHLLGLDSLMAVELLHQVEEGLGVTLSLQAVLNGATLEDLAATIIKDATPRRESQSTIPIREQQHGELCLLSENQAALWFLSQLTPESPAANVSVLLRAPASPDEFALRLALDRLSERHATLRTTYETQGDVPVQRIHSALSLDWGSVDAVNWEWSRVRQEALQAAAIPFDLVRGPVWRARFFRGDQQAFLLLVAHHIAVDGWSMTLLVEELRRHYVLASSDASTDDEKIGPAPTPYTDFVGWHRALLESEEGRRLAHYWKERLRGELPNYDTLYDQPRTTVEPDRYAWHRFGIETVLSARMKNLAQVEGTTVYTICLAALKVVLYRYTNQEDTAIASPVFGRSRACFTHCVGDFVNVLILRDAVKEDMIGRVLIAQTKRMVLEALDHQDYPFSRLVTELCPTRDLQRVPLAQVMFVLQKFKLLAELDSAMSASAPVKHWQTGWDAYVLPQHSGQFDICVEVAESEEGFSGYFEYKAQLYEPETIARLQEHFIWALEGLVMTPDVPIGALPLMADAERQRLLVEWSGSNQPTAELQCLHHVIEAEAIRTPNGIAVREGDQTLTYRELNARANRLAHYLSQCGVGPDVVVGLCLNRSLNLIVGLLGILKSGGAYLPLDVDYPTERLAYMLMDSQVRVLVTQQDQIARFPAFKSRTICLDSEWAKISRCPDGALRLNQSTENLAYVMYTSGSTGNPQGVLIEHRAMANYVHAIIHTIGLTARDRMLQFASLSFDTAAEEIFPCLATGGTLVLRSSTMVDSVSGFLEACRQAKVTVLDLPTAYWHEVVIRMELEQLTFPETVHTVIIGGERAIPKIVQRWARLMGPRVRLLNTYGPTETTVAATFSDLTGLGCDGDLSEDVPIGRPIPQVSVYVLDQHQKPVPVGVTGELYIGGAGVARGYVRRSDITEARFVPDPFSGRTGARLYRTGDLVRWRPDGQLNYRGRIDRQVKIRGFRIELEEIEAVLNRQPELEQAVVEVREDQPGDRRIVAFLVWRPQSKLGLVQLRERLRSRLPAHMVPSTFMELETLPMTPNGKVDRQVLRVALDSRASKVDVTADFVAPRNSTEQMLAHIWGEILHVNDIGVHDNFFELGGHSLLATQLVSRVQSLFQIRLPLRRVFETPTIATLAEAIQDATTGSRSVREEESRVITRVPRGQPLPLSFAQERMWFLYQLAPEAAAYSIPASVRLHGPLNKAALRWSVQELVQRHEVLRTTFTQVDGQPRQIIHASLDPLWTEVDLRMLPRETRERRASEVATAEARRPFDLAHGPLLRVVLIDMGEEDHILMVTTHHIISDQWSYGVIARELVKCYNAFSEGKPTPLQAELAIQYADFAQWQREWLKGSVLREQLAYWKSKLANLPVMTLPGDRPRPSVHSFKGDYVSIDLPWVLVNRLKQLSVQEGVTLHMVFLAGFFGLLNRLTQQRDIVIGIPIANRQWLAIEDLIGAFVNTLVLRTDVSNEIPFREFLAKIRDLSLEAYAHQDVPFEKLVEELRPDRSQGGLPLVQVLFNFANTPFARTEFLHIAWTPYEVSRGASQLDLGLSIDPLASRKAYLEFNTDMFDRATVERWLMHYRQIMEAIANNPQETLERLEILTEQQQHQVLREWNTTDIAFDQETCFPRLFEAQAGRTPGSIAVSMEGQALTYEALEAQSNQLANYLRRIGVDRGTVIGICLDRSPAMVVGLLAIMKAGAAYVPLDLAYPRDRVNFMVQDSGVRIVVTSSSLADRLPFEGRDTVCIDRESERIGRESVQPMTGPDPSDVAYVIYTSGSTGKPKGVEICHRSLLNFLWSMRTRPGCTDRDVLLSVTTLSFDIAGLELYLPLLVGGRVELVSRQVASDGRLLKRRMDECRPSIMQATPATWRMLIDGGWEGSPHLTALCGGEALSRDLADHILARTGALWNMYGPTETTIWSTISKIERDGSEVTIGRPIANTQLYILDSSLRPVPIGVRGELYIGGDGVALGYRNRPELTAERFIPHPFHDRPGARLYKTGDLARYRSDGQVVHLGRLDHQVKIRGFRIEPGEIEAALRAHASIRQAVVTARPDRSGAQQLVAYLIPVDGQRPSGRELRTFLRGSLPDYMVPSHFMVMASFPLTANGKVDVLALPDPIEGGPASAEAGGEPRTPLEVQLAALWQQVLGVSVVSLHDNFFELGGHSLSAVQLFAHLEQVFGKSLPLATLFQAPTVAQLAAVLTAADWAAPWRSLVAIQPGGTRPPLFAVPGVGGNVLVFAKLAQLLGSDQPFYGLQPLGLDGTTKPLTSVVEMASQYVDEIRTVRPVGPYVIAGTCTGGVIAFEMAEQLMQRGEQVALVIVESWHPSSYLSHRRKPPMALWPMLFLCSKAVSYATQLLHTPIREWTRFVRDKLSTMRGLMTGGTAQAASMIEDSAVAQERVTQATLWAVARYEIKRYSGRLLNLIASKRPVMEGVSDTRTTWAQLAQGGGQTVSIPAEDSGRLFVSPHVEQLSRHLFEYTAVAFRETSSPPACSSPRDRA